MTYYDMIQQRKRENLEFIKSLNISESCEDLERNVDPGKKRLRGRPKGSTSDPSKRASTSDLTPSRKSRRLTKKDAPMFPDVEEIEKRARKAQIKNKASRRKDITFGAIENVPVGSEFSSRTEAWRARIHRAIIAGFYGEPTLGCCSIVLSGGYEDEDLGESFIYTGVGGRDLKRNKGNLKNLKNYVTQSKGPELSEEHLALSKNVENNLPVRVLRGSLLKSNYAPVEGYRYDGLYKVFKFNVATGKSGVAEYNFKFERLANQGPAPWSEDFQKERSENLKDYTISSEKENVPIMEMEVVKVSEHPMTSEDKE